MRKWSGSALALAVMLAWSVGAASAEDESVKAQAELKDADGQSVGTVSLAEAPGDQGTVVHVTLENLPEGVHAIHIHAVGKCDAPDFKSAEGHFNPDDKAHGIFNPDGHHAGDLPNLYVPETGQVEVEYFSSLLMLDGDLLDEDGAAVIVHKGADDYRTEPAGDAGSRIACGVIEN